MSLTPSKGNSLQVRDLEVRYGSQPVVHSVSLTIDHAQIGCLLGPSGCGKSTLLRAIAGLELAARGEIKLGDRVLTDGRTNVVTEDRHIGMVFQDIALFPHLTVSQNIAFGLKKHSREAKRERVSYLLDLVGLPGIEERYPNSLSGGQQQRIALARALAPKPKTLLMDEPFSGLDATLKETLVPDIRAILVKEQITALVVTHDQMEAFALADKVAVMNQGVIEQSDSPYVIYHQPATRFVADFIGQGYFLPATVLNSNQINTDLGVLDLPEPTDYATDTQVDVLLRPDDVLHNDDSNYQGMIVGKQFKGTYFQYQVQLSNGRSLMCIASSHHNHSIGQLIGIRLDLDHIMLFNPESVTLQWMQGVRA
ncbi:MAG: ABC transporter ATP-binding protein [Reinekea sp.]